MAECKFCGAEVEVGQICEYCGRKAEAWYYTDETVCEAKNKNQENIALERIELPESPDEKFCSDLGELIAKSVSAYPIERGIEKYVEEAILNAIMETYKIDAPETVEVVALYKPVDDRVYPVFTGAVRFSRWSNSIEYEIE